MESESVLIMHSLTIRYVLAPGELDLVAIVLTLRRCDDRMELRIHKRILDPVEGFGDLSFLDLELLGIWDREPLTATVELPLGWDREFEWTLLHCAQYLCFDMILLALEYSQIDYCLRYGSSRDDDPSAIWCGRESTSSEYELLDSDVLDDVVLAHVHSV